MNVGSPFWMAPEVIEMSTATTASDIWYNVSLPVSSMLTLLLWPNYRSVACTIIELLQGEPPFFDLGNIQAMFKIVNEKCSPPLPEDISEVHFYLFFPFFFDCSHFNPEK